MKQEEVLTYEIIQERKKEQERLIAEGKMQRPQLVDDVFTEEDWKIFNDGLTFEELWNKVEKKLDMK